MSRVDIESLRKSLRLYLVLGSANCHGDPAAAVEEAVRGGVTMVQFREKGRNALKGAAKEELARRILVICRSFSIPLIINDDVDLALAIDADGVHIGQDDEPAERVRTRIGDKILGLSVHSVEEAKRAENLAVDYFGVGPIYPTQSKDDAREAQGPGVLRDLRRENVSLPLVGIGGITAERAADVIGAGADGIAVISAITGAQDLRQAAQQLAHKVRASSSGRI
ncbi:thiamine phosphate synthase [Paenibacillus sp. HJL G12]|uniref:Thiamine-phosphate synthase n=1 Tax=Paenibacillus dendrobii TaxID=2691084 RepID=A0A7X3IK23_9BACL|nr:thiamine phosphate synthase [Paenibacillus dendrobii]MWV45417.1 thiamine phosphate synthase [Paenibacillus dendrobii]